MARSSRLWLQPDSDVVCLMRVIEPVANKSAEAAPAKSKRLGWLAKLLISAVWLVRSTGDRSPLVPGHQPGHASERTAGGTGRRQFLLAAVLGRPAPATSGVDRKVCHLPSHPGLGGHTGCEEHDSVRQGKVCEQQFQRAARHHRILHTPALPASRGSSFWAIPSPSGPTSPTMKPIPTISNPLSPTPKS